MSLKALLTSDLVPDKNRCSGCGACRQTCPEQAIEMKPDEYGFVYPSINTEFCIGCRSCLRVCPYKNDEIGPKEPPCAYGLRYNNDDIRKQSSSGGAFTALYEAVKPDFVFGAVMDSDLQVFHRSAEKEEGIEAFRGSKYVQSDTKDTFKECKRLLDKDAVVLYTGTPCQIAGLKQYLGKKYEKLFTCDLICEGVQSQHFFDEYIKYVEKKEKKKVTAIKFRNKDRRGWERSEIVLSFDDGTEYRRIAHTKDTEYMNSMLFEGGDRPSCYACPFAKLPRQGDFTIGDLWGWDEIIPEWSDNTGISLILCNSEKALDRMKAVSQTAAVKEIELQKAAKKNPNIERYTSAPVVREEYMQDVKTMSFEKLAQKWLKPRSGVRRLLSEVKYRLKRS